jgi:hypothetical protein
MKPIVIKLRPSDAHRWLVCRASPGYVARLDAEGKLPKVVYDYTVEGQQAHLLAAKLLNDQALPAVVDKDMLAHVRAYAVHVRKQLARHVGATLLVEHKVDVYYSDRKGYIDAAIVELNGSDIYVIDLKYGRGVSVKAERNPQLTIYVKSLVEQIKTLYPLSGKTKVHITIWQPRVASEKVERTWDTTLKEIDNGCFWIDSVAQDILTKPYEQKFEPDDDVCQFCPAQALCEARARDLLDDTSSNALTTFSAPAVELDPPEPATLSLDQVARIIKVADPLRAWLKKVEAHALGVAQAGVAVPGFKLVQGSPGRRKWTDPVAAEALLRRMFPKEVATPAEVISPAQAETLMKERKCRQAMWDAFEALVTRPEGSATLAPADDERPALDATAQAREHFEEPGEELL